MRRTLVNIMAIACVVSFILLIINVVFDGISINEVLKGGFSIILFFQILGVNTVVFCGLHFTQKFESKYVFWEILLDICFVSIVLVIFGLVFNHFRDRLWIFPIIAVVTYTFGFLTDMVRTQNLSRKINAKLKRRKEKNKSAAS